MRIKHEEEEEGEEAEEHEKRRKKQVIGRGRERGIITPPRPRSHARPVLILSLTAVVPPPCLVSQFLLAACWMLEMP